MEVDVQAVSTSARRMKILGALTIVLGLLAMMAPIVAGISIAMLVGGLIVAAGIMRVVWALHAASFGQGLLKLLVGGLTLICGIAMLSNPLFASGVLTVVVTVYLLVDGLCELAAGFSLRPEPGSGWLILGGAMSFVLGILIWQQYPLSGPWAIGIMLGIKLLFVGMTMMMIGSRVKSAVRASAA